MIKLLLINLSALIKIQEPIHLESFLNLSGGVIKHPHHHHPPSPPPHCLFQSFINYHPPLLIYTQSDYLCHHYFLTKPQTLIHPHQQYHPQLSIQLHANLDHSTTIVIALFSFSFTLTLLPQSMISHLRITLLLQILQPPPPLNHHHHSLTPIASTPSQIYYSHPFVVPPHTSPPLLADFTPLQSFKYQRSH